MDFLEQFPEFLPEETNAKQIYFKNIQQFGRNIFLIYYFYPNFDFTLDIENVINHSIHSVTIDSRFETEDSKNIKILAEILEKNGIIQ